MSNPSRADSLSFILTKSIPNDRLKENVLISIINNLATKELSFIFRDGTIKKVSRAAGGIPQNQVVMIQSALINGAGELVVTLTDGRVLNYGVVRLPENFIGFEGTGVFTGVEGGKLIFKPLVAGSGTTLENGKLKFLGLNETDRTFDGYARFWDEPPYGGSLSGGAYRTRVLRSSQSNIPEATLTANVVTLPPGKYYCSGFVKAYRVNLLIGRLWNSTEGIVQLRGQPCNPSVGTGYNAEAYSHFSGYFTLTQTCQFVLQSWVGTTYTSHSLSYGANNLEFWKVG